MFPGSDPQKVIGSISQPSSCSFTGVPMSHGWVDQKSCFIIPVRLRAFGAEIICYSFNIIQ